MPSTHAQYLDLGRNRVSAGLAHASWTIDKAFPGQKLMFEANYAFSRRSLSAPESGVTDEKLFGILGAELQWGKGETGLERYDISIAPIVGQRTYEITPGQRLKPGRDFFEWGAIRVDEDDPLGLDFYAEASIVRAGRAWQKRSAARPVTMTVDVHVTMGWAWASSFDDRYRDVSNPYTGLLTRFSWEHDSWGQIYVMDRVMSGTSLGSPKDAMSREALIRFGYFKRVPGCFRVGVFIEKRSFNFSDETLPSLYTKSKRYGAQLECQFGA